MTGLIMKLTKCAAPTSDPGDVLDTDEYTVCALKNEKENNGLNCIYNQNDLFLVSSLCSLLLDFYSHELEVLDAILSGSFFQVSS